MARKRKVNPELVDDENPAWTEQDFARARPGVEVLPAGLLRKVRGRAEGADQGAHHDPAIA